MTRFKLRIKETRRFLTWTTLGGQSLDYCFDSVDKALVLLRGMDLEDVCEIVDV